ncbi:MAG TPA: hypothetical protein VD866_18065, partial [Urbifossiella sp.]|nr:hypothetical protein [Urbifossiella sp.]
FGGLGAFFDGSVGYKLPHRLVGARNAVYAGRWADVRDGDVIERMREIAADPGRAAELGEIAAARAARFTWERTARELAAALAWHGMLT